MQKKRGTLIFLKPRQFIPVLFGKFLRSFDHIVDEVSAPTQAAQDEKVCQDTQKTTQVNVLIL